MWIKKVFKSQSAMNNFIEKKQGKIQYVEVFVNNGYCIEYRKLRRIL